MAIELCENAHFDIKIFYEGCHDLTDKDGCAYSMTILNGRPRIQTEAIICFESPTLKIAPEDLQDITVNFSYEFRIGAKDEGLESGQALFHYLKQGCQNASCKASVMSKYESGDQFFYIEGSINRNNIVETSACLQEAHRYLCLWIKNKGEMHSG